MTKSKNGALNWAIDILIFAYTISIFIMSYVESLNKYSKILALALMGLLAIYVLIKGTIKFNGVILCFVGFTAWGLLSYFWAPDKEAVLEKAFTMLQLLILFWLLYIYLSKENKVEMLILALCVAGAVFAVYVLATNGLSVYVSGLDEGTRMGVDELNVNTIGLATSTAALISFWYAFYRKKYYFLIFSAISIFVAFGTGSRKVLIMLAIGIVLMFILKGNAKKKIISILECVAVLLILYAVLQLPIFETINERFDSMLAAFSKERGADNSALKRLKMIDIGWDQFLKTPVGGIGLSNSHVLTYEYMSSSGYLHNNYIELLACVGVVGFVLYYAMYLIPLKKLIIPAIKCDSLAILGVILLVVVLVIEFGAVRYYSKPTYIHILIFCLVAEKVGKK